MNSSFPAGSSTRLRLLPVTLLLFAGVFFSYLPALSGLPVWDDEFLVKTNPFFRSPLFIGEVFRHWLFPDSISVYYRPLQNLSYLLDYGLWRGEPFGYHLTNLLLHWGAAVFLFVLLRRLLPGFLDRGLGPEDEKRPAMTEWIAFAIAAIWAVHPIHNAAVAYIAGRADSLAALFALGGWCLFLRTCEGEKTRPMARIAGFAGAWALGLLALCSKEIAITWLVLFAVVHLFFVRLSASRLKIIATLGLMLGCYYLLRHLPEARQAPPAMAYPLPVRAMLMLRALGDYTRLIFWPSTLEMNRMVAPELIRGATGGSPLTAGLKLLPYLGTLTLAAFILGSRRMGRGWVVRRLGAIWFAIGFLPVSNLVPLNAQVAEHWIYMPSLGFLLFLAGCILELPANWKKGIAALLCVAIPALSIRTYYRAEDWTGSKHFYTDSLEKGVVDERLASNLAKIYLTEGKPAEAEALLEPYLAKSPFSALLNMTSGLILRAQKRDAEAEPRLRLASQSNYPYARQAVLHLADIRMKQGRLKEALATVEEVLGRMPSTPLILLKTHILYKMGRESEGFAFAKTYAEENWWNLKAQIFLAKLTWKSGDTQAAIDLLQRAAWLDIWGSDALELAASIDLSRNRPEEALRFAKRGISRHPTIRQYSQLAKIYQQLGRAAEAEAASKEARLLLAMGANLKEATENPALAGQGE